MKRKFKYPLNATLVDVDGRNTFWWGGLFREDHFGDRDVPLGEAVRQRVCKEMGIFPSGVIDYVGSLRTYRVVFNPICFFLVWSDESRIKVDFVVTEVSNTPWGQRTVHVLDVRAGHKAPIVRAKSIHVSPFNPVPDGKQLWEYRFNSLPPSGRMDVSVTLYADQAAYTAKTPVVAAHMSLAKIDGNKPRFLPPAESILVLMRIHWQAVVLSINGMAFVGNTTTCPLPISTGPGFLGGTAFFLAAVLALAYWAAAWIGVVTAVALVGTFAHRVCAPIE